MEVTEFVWFKSPEILAAIVAIISSIISVIFGLAVFKWKGNVVAKMSKDTAKFTAELDNKKQEIQNSLDVKLEQIRIQYGNVFSERLSVFKEMSIKISEIEVLVNKISSYHSYSCKENVDFNEGKCKTDGTCDSNCIINYWDSVVEVGDNLKEYVECINRNQMFLSLSMYKNHIEIAVEIKSKVNSVINTLDDASMSKKERAFYSFEVFEKIDIMDLKEELVDEYRKVLGIDVPKI